MKFLHFDMLPLKTETKRSIKELMVFNVFDLFVDWNFSKVANLAAEVCPTNLRQ